MQGHVAQEGEDGDVMIAGIENEVNRLNDHNVKRLEGPRERG